jgi:hypothetical protein
MWYQRIRAVLVGLCVALPARAVAQAAATAEPPALTPAQWREDLRTMAEQMERRHRNLYHTVSREDFARAVAALDARIPTLQRHQIVVGMMRLAAMVGDAHTNVSPLKDERLGLRSLPLKLYLFADGVYVRAAAPGHAALVGARVEAVGGVPIAEALRRVGEISPRDNDVTPTLYAPIYLAMPAVAHALAMGPHPDTATLLLRKGARTWTARVPAGAVEPRWPPDTDVSLVTPRGWVDARATPEPPLWLAAPLDYHRMVEPPGARALYVQLNMVADVKDQSLTRFGERILERVAATNPRAVILDVRLNRGGNGDLRSGLVRSLIRAEDADTRLFVLSWRGAFSATQFILDDLERLTDAVFVGEPASSRPSSYGDSYRITLPNSGLTVRASIRWHQNGSNDRRPWTPVHVATPYAFASYVAGRDPALEAALAYVPPAALHERASAAARERGIPGVEQAFASWLADPVNRYQDVQHAAIVAAARLHGEKRAAEAVGLMERAARRDPTNPDLQVVLAQLADLAGRRELALAAARRTLALDGDNRTARAMVARLEPGAP